MKRKDFIIDLYHNTWLYNQLIQYELYKKTVKVQNKNFWYQGFMGWIFCLLLQNYTYSMYNNNSTHFKASRTVTIKRKFTALNEPSYSNQVLDTQILWVMIVREKNLENWVEYKVF